MSDSKTGLEQIRSRATALFEAYQQRLRRLWWPNLVFMVLPAVLTTAAAIVAALPAATAPNFGLPLPAASVFAGAAAVLLAVHKALKCDEYQAECLRLGQAFQSIATAADLALSGPEGERDKDQERLSNDVESLIKDAKAQVKTNFPKS